MRKEFQPVNDLIAGALRGALDCDCPFCAHLEVNPVLADRALEAFQRRLLSKQDCAPQVIHALKMLVRARHPLQGVVFEDGLSIDARERKAIMRQLRDGWLLPVCATRQRPFGYFIAETPAEFLEWQRVTRSQAIAELATAHKVFKANFPELAGQQSLAFIDQVSTELQEAIR
jgi:hypothetical protein